MEREKIILPIQIVEPTRLRPGERQILTIDAGGQARCYMHADSWGVITLRTSQGDQIEIKVFDLLNGIGQVMKSKEERNRSDGENQSDHPTNPAFANCPA